MKLNEINRKIDKIDRELLVLLQERMGLSLRSNKFQLATGETEREEDMLERMERLNLDLIKRSFSFQPLAGTDYCWTGVSLNHIGSIENFFSLILSNRGRKRICFVRKLPQFVSYPERQILQIFRYPT